MPSVSRTLDLASAAPTRASEDSSTDEDLSPEAMYTGLRFGMGAKAFKIAAGLLCFAGLSVLAVSHAGSRAPQQELAAQPTSVRALLESPELADLATDNVMAVGGEKLSHAAGRDQVHAAVTRKLQNISSSLRAFDPKAHEKLGLIQLSSAQKGQVLGVLRHYGDKRVIGLAKLVSDAVKETAKTSGDEAALKRRLLEKLSPRSDDLAQLGKELFPGRGSKGISLNFDNSPVTKGFGKWHMQMKMSAPKIVTKARRLTAEDLANGAVTVQARTMFHQLGEIFGDEMPSAPGRMLQEAVAAPVQVDPEVASFGTEQAIAEEHEHEHESAPQVSGQDNNSNLMECLMQEFQEVDIEGALHCIMENISAVFHLIEKALISVLPGLRR
jgi:hypothetical protein